MENVDGEVVEASAFTAKAVPFIEQLNRTQGNELLEATGNALSIVPVENDGFFIGMNESRLEEKIYDLEYRTKFPVSGMGTPRGMHSGMTCEQRAGYTVWNFYKPMSANADTIEILRVRVGGIKGEREGTCIYGLSEVPKTIKYEKKKNAKNK